MRRGTTPTYTLTFEEGVGSQIADICLAIHQQNGPIMNLHMSEGKIILSGDVAYCTLTQEETNAFHKGSCKRQVKVKFVDGTVQSSDITNESVYDVLHEEVL